MDIERVRGRVGRVEVGGVDKGVEVRLRRGWERRF